MSFDKVVKRFVKPPEEPLPIWACPQCRGHILKCECYKPLIGVSLREMEQQAAATEREKEEL